MTYTPRASVRARRAPRDYFLTVRLSQRERERLQKAAARAGITLSDYVRRRLLKSGR